MCRFSTAVTRGNRRRGSEREHGGGEDRMAADNASLAAVSLSDRLTA